MDYFENHVTAGVNIKINIQILLKRTVSIATTVTLTRGLVEANGRESHALPAK